MVLIQLLSFEEEENDFFLYWNSVWEHVQPVTLVWYFNNLIKYKKNDQIVFLFLLLFLNIIGHVSSMELIYVLVVDL